MIRHDLAVALLGLGVAVTIAAGAGVALMRSVYDRLHYQGLASVLGAPLVCAAVALEEGLSRAAGRALLVALLLLVMNPALAHATARAARTHEERR